MKANELMIGDIVLHENKPYFIRELGIFGVDRDDNDYPAVCIGKKNGIGLIVERDEIFPITITTEILERNGFKVDTIRNRACYYYDKKLVNDIFHRIDEVVRIEVFAKSAKAEETGLILLQIGYPDDCNKQIDIEIRYVHELQHALKLCGIEKTIEL